MAYPVKTPWWLRTLYPRFTWRMPAANEEAIYLTFDDGPHPTATPFTLDLLEQYNAKATFFCIGKNVVEQPDIYREIIEQGHSVGNHTHNHLNGWKSDMATYIENVAQAGQHINSRLFRPPYGRIKRSQASMLFSATEPYRIIMWDVLSGDFDVNISPEKCLENVINNITPGSIILFHDSEKAWKRMSYALPEVLKYCQQKNWQLKALPQ